MAKKKAKKAKKVATTSDASGMKCPKCGAGLIVPIGKSSPAAHNCKPAKEEE
jgi:hypothetical protein